MEQFGKKDKFLLQSLGIAIVFFYTGPCGEKVAARQSSKIAQIPPLIAAITPPCIDEPKDEPEG